MMLTPPAVGPPINWGPTIPLNQLANDAIASSAAHSGKLIGSVARDLSQGERSEIRSVPTQGNHGRQ